VGEGDRWIASFSAPFARRSTEASKYDTLGSLVDVPTTLVKTTLFALFASAACGGTSVRRDAGDDANGGSTSEAASGGSAGAATGGGSASSVHPTPSPCSLLQVALSDAKTCSTDADCGQLVGGWPCARPEGLPPVVNLRADVSDLPDLYARAESRGECSLVTYGCDNCVVDGFGCFDGSCEWRDVDCGPPPK